MNAALAADPVAAVQQQYPVHRTTITGTSGTIVCYVLPPDAPLELKRAYKVLEVAEREVVVSESLQTLEREYVANERFLEALRTNYAAFYLRSPNTWGPRFFSFMPLTMPESTMKRAASMNLNRSWAADRALAAIDRLGLAHFQLQQVLDGLAHPDRPKQAFPPMVPLDRVNIVAAPSPLNPVKAVTPRDQARQAEQAAAKAESAAEERERAARAKDLAAEAAYRASLPDERDAARKAWLAAREEWEEARKAWDAARDKWQAARDKVNASPPTAPVIRSQPVTQVRRTR
jgi:hypothetical protein